MTEKSSRGKDTESRYLGLDRTIAGAAFLMVIFVFLLVAFTAPSMELSLPGLAGCIYIVCFIIVAVAAILVWRTRGAGKRKKTKTLGLKAIKATRPERGRSGKTRAK